MIRTVANGALGLVVALAALAFVHQQWMPGRAALCAGLALGAVAASRAPWSTFPALVTRWLEAGVVLTVVLVCAAASGASLGLPFALARWQELVALWAAAATAGTATWTQLRLAQEVAASAERLAAVERRELQSRLSALAAQVNPHFLFNTLNTLAELVHQDEDRAEDLITDLAGMMRYALRGSVARVPLGDELDVVRRLLRIEAVRLGPRLTWRIDADADTAGVPIPGLLIQPIVENAVRHGIAPRPEGGRVEVAVTLTGDRVTVVVADDGPGLPDEVASALAAPGRGTAGAGGGLRSTALRASLAWPPGQAELVVDRSAPGTRLVLTFPAGAR